MLRSFGALLCKAVATRVAQAKNSGSSSLCRGTAAASCIGIKEKTEHSNALYTRQLVSVSMKDVSWIYVES